MGVVLPASFLRFPHGSRDTSHARLSFKEVYLSRRGRFEAGASG